MRLSGRVAVVTGAAGGIGAALAAELLARGAAVLLTDLDAGRLAVTVERLEAAYPGRVDFADGDASSEADIRGWVERAGARLGPVDLYAANAGLGDGSGLDATDEQWQRALDVNLMAHVRAARVLVPEWVERGEGHFLSTASAAGLLTQVGSAIYSVTKHGAVGFAEWLAVTYGGQGVGVTCLCPMGVDTDMLRGGMGRADDPRGRQAVAAVKAAGEVLSPEHVAGVTLDAVEAGRFLVLPHEHVREMVRRKHDDPDRWIAGMQRYAASLTEGPWPAGGR